MNWSILQPHLSSIHHTQVEKYQSLSNDCMGYKGPHWSGFGHKKAISQGLGKERVKLTLIHAPVIYQIPWFHWIHRIDVPFKENSIEYSKFNERHSEKTPSFTSKDIPPLVKQIIS